MSIGRASCVTIVIPLLLVCASVFAQIPVGESKRTIKLSQVDMNVLIYRPQCSNPALLLAFHGTLRKYATVLKEAKPLAKALCLILVAPELDRETFPESRYQLGGIVAGHQVQSPQEWTGSIVLDLVARARQQEGRKLDYFLIGHSAGGQFLGRVAAYLPTEAKRIVIANPSTYVLPTLETNAPYGMGGVFSPEAAEAALRRYLAQPVTIFLGQEDTGDRFLAKGRNAREQGTTRHDRGLKAFAAGETLARARGWTFNWRLVEVPGIGHDSKKMYGSAEAAKAIQP